MKEIVDDDLEGDMGWDEFNQIKKLYDDQDFINALLQLSEHRDAFRNMQAHAVGLEASCYAKIGQSRKAYDLLKTLTNSKQANYWTYYQLGAICRTLMLYDESLRSYHQAHELQGWDESPKNGYLFTHDFFSPNIPNWTTWFDTLITSAPIQCLEIGSWQGGSATWLLDRVISQRGGLLSCIDTFEGSSEHQNWINTIQLPIEDIFDSNVKLTGYSASCVKLKGASTVVLKTLENVSYDFIYIDGAHEAESVLQDAVLSWPLLKRGGFLLFDDIEYRFPAKPQANTDIAIDAFKRVFEASIAIKHQGRQLLVEKLV